MSVMRLTKKDFQNDNEVRWCPGCGDYAILATVQKTLADLGLNKDETVFVSGIGCAARFPYYMNTYGIHTIHGRAPAFATGIKLSNPKLKVFLVTGDGDGLSIGASHLIHLLRRNIDLTVLLFNNQIYGLTKGQYSPTSQEGIRAKSTPFGSLEKPINPLLMALSSGASFVARAVDNDVFGLSEVLKEAYFHKGSSFIEILQNCLVFNDGAFDHVREKSEREKHALLLKNKAPLLFNQNEGLTLDLQSLTIKKTNEPANFMIHDVESLAKANMLAQLSWPDFPVPLGIFYKTARKTFEEEKARQDEVIKSKLEHADLSSLLKGNNYWQI